VIIASNKDVHLISQCLASLEKQNLNQNDFEVLFVFNGGRSPVSAVEQEKLQELELNIQILYRPEGQTNSSRNWGAYCSKAPYILFLDDDCILPHSNYLKERIDCFESSPKLSGIGGFYLSPKANSATSHTYNLISNACLMAKGALEKNPHVLLGGACAYRKSDFMAHRGFQEDCHGAGEEILLHKTLKQADLQLAVKRRFSVHHNFRGSLKKLISRARCFGHGMKLQLPGENIVSHFKPLRAAFGLLKGNARILQWPMIGWQALLFVFTLKLSEWHRRLSQKPEFSIPETTPSHLKK